VPIDPEYCSFIGRWTPCGTPVTRVPPHATTQITGRGDVYGWDILDPPMQDVDSLHLSIHVRDLAHPDVPGVEIPAIRVRDLRNGRVVLPGVPTSARFRTNLRVYSGASTITVTIADSTTGAILDARSVRRFFPTDVDTFDLTDFRDFFDTPQVRAHDRVDVFIDTESYDHYWALLTLTDNVTQQVTTYMPQ